MLLKGFRQYDEHDVINLFSLAEASGNAGDLVQYQAWNPSASDGYDINQNLSPFAGMAIPRYVNNAKVALVPAGGNALLVAGCLLWDVRTTDALGRPYIYDAQRWQEQQVVYSGQTVPVCKRGIFLVSGFSGTAAPGSGIGVGAQNNGQWSVIGPAVTPRLGTWLSSSGADGSAMAYLNVV